MSDLTRDEFITNIGYVRDDVKGVHDRLDMLNGRTRKLENIVAVIEDRAKQQATPQDVRKYGSLFGALGAGSVGMLYAAYELVTSKFLK